MTRRDNQLAMLPGDVTVLNLFDAPAPTPQLAPVVEPARCAACHGRTDDRSPRCLCAIQPEGPARALALMPNADNRSADGPTA